MMEKINFIHIPKNAGMTIRHSPYLKNRIYISSSDRHKSSEYTRALLDQMNRYGEHHGYEHARWRDLNTEAQKNRSFAIIRNPWSKVISRYTFMELAYKNGSQYVKTSKSFEEFLEERHEWGNKEYFWHRAIKGWYSQKDHVTNEEGNLQCDILRFEHFNEDIKKYFGLTQTLAIRNVSNGTKSKDMTVISDIVDYRTFYTNNTKKIVEDWYAEDIEYFGFTFNGPATKNIWNKG